MWDRPDRTRCTSATLVAAIHSRAFPLDRPIGRIFIYLYIKSNNWRCGRSGLVKPYRKLGPNGASLNTRRIFEQREA